MNYLAHLYLAGDDPKAQVGQVLADFVLAREIDSFEPGIRAGIRAHQRIDVFTDSHPVVAAARRRMVAPYRRYGNILLDMFFDHFLAKNWDRYRGDVSLEQFSQQCYRVLNGHRDVHRERFQQVVISMQNGDWLGSYRDLDNIDRALRGISRRLTGENPLATGVSVLRVQYDELEADFKTFFPELAHFVRERTAAPED